MSMFPGKRFVWALLALLLASCTHYEPYPARWAPLLPSDPCTCPDISGTYFDSGELSDGTSDESLEQSLSYRLCSCLSKPVPPHAVPTGNPMDLFRARPTPAKTVRIRHPSMDTIEVSVFKDSALSDTWILSKAKGEFSCEAQGVLIPCRADFRIGEGFFVGWWWSKTYLYKSSDQCLVTNTVGTVAGLDMIFPVLPFPVFGRGSRWHRFKPTVAGGP